MNELEFVGFNKIPRYNRDVIITEKIDGTNAQILIAEWSNDPAAPPSIAKFETSNGQRFGMWAGSRNRWLDIHNDNFGFANWVGENYGELSHLGPGRHFGEWWGKGIQRGYGLNEKRFSLFKPRPEGNPLPACVGVVPILKQWGNPSDRVITEVLMDLKTNGSVAAPGFMKPEGIVIFHTKSRQLYKITLEDDNVGKEEAARAKANRPTVLPPIGIPSPFSTPRSLAGIPNTVGAVTFT